MTALQDQQVPRLQWPLAVTETGRLAAVEQDSPEDIGQCLVALLRTRVGDRPDQPDMGTPDLAFQEEPVDLDGVKEILARHEPRAAVLASEEPDLIDQAIDTISLDWQEAQGA